MLPKKLQWQNFNSEVAMDIATEAIQIMGANGYVREEKLSVTLEMQKY